jgi:hypothetical protein
MAGTGEKTQPGVSNWIKTSPVFFYSRDDSKNIKSCTREKSSFSAYVIYFISFILFERERERNKFFAMSTGFSLLKRK